MQCTNFEMISLEIRIDFDDIWQKYSYYYGICML